MVGELQEMVEELETENQELNEQLQNEQEEVMQYKAEYERIQQEGSQLFEKYEQKTRRCETTLEPKPHRLLFFSLLFPGRSTMSIFDSHVI